jgi:hypothetical protein
MCKHTNYKSSLSEMWEVYVTADLSDTQSLQQNVCR